MSQTPSFWQRLAGWLAGVRRGQKSSPTSNESSPSELGTVLDPTQLTEGTVGTPTTVSETLRVSSPQQLRISPEEELGIQQQIATKLRQIGLPAATFATLEQQVNFYAQLGLALQCFYEASCRAMVWAAVTSNLEIKASQIICLPTDVDNIVGQAAFTGRLHLPLEVIYLGDPVPLLKTTGQGVALWVDTVPEKGRSSIQWRLFLEYVLRPSLRPAPEEPHGTE